LLHRTNSPASAAANPTPVFAHNPDGGGGRRGVEQLVPPKRESSFTLPNYGREAMVYGLVAVLDSGGKIRTYGIASKQGV